MHNYYVFPHPTIAEGGTPGLTAFKVNPNYGQYEEKNPDENNKDKAAITKLKKLNYYVDFNVYDIQQLLYSYGIAHSKIVQADSVEAAIRQSKYMNAEKLIASESFDRQQFEMMSRKNKPLADYLRENHAYRIEFDSYPYNLGHDIQTLRGDRISRDHGMIIGEKKIIRLTNGDGITKRYKAMQMHVDALFVKQPWEKDLEKSSKKPDDTVVLVPKGNLLILTNDKFWDANSYKIMPDFAWQVKAMSGRKNLDDNQKTPHINVA